ncbi:MAG TPA: dihydrolipoamide acetyltransferase family protein [Anaerolineales bacterium]|nr:dihydrolipoamide acetyltransferase family protein [candidate division Zixibacteria bacterium]HUV93046.1 dihydrolipoamide acetyltransferase family protein [Anaerolineales bacterium]
MASAILMPKQGNTVESCLIIEWLKGVGDQIETGEVLCVVETDKATLEVESTASGSILTLYFDEGDDVPVLTPIAAIGKTGEDFAGLGPDTAEPRTTGIIERGVTTDPKVVRRGLAAKSSRVPNPISAIPKVGISPRAKKLAQEKDVQLANIKGTGPYGRIIERDVLAVSAHPRLTPVARRMIDHGEYTVPEVDIGISGRITSRDLIPSVDATQYSPASTESSTRVQEDVLEIPVNGIRKVIAERMLSSVQTTAQLTLHTSADARTLLSYRRKLKNSSERLGLREVTVGDLILYVVSRTLPDFPEINALFNGESIFRYHTVHLALAVDTPRGLLVPVIRNAQILGLRQVSLEAKRLANACQKGHIKPDELAGGTFTVSNLGAFGIESFTPILNPPQVGILGVGNINLKPVDVKGKIHFFPHIGLSLTINHQIVDGAPGARFLETLSDNLSDIELLVVL